MISELYLENYRLDINQNLSSLLTFAIDNIRVSVNDKGSFASRQTSFSKTIVLPGTANNNKILGNVFDISMARDYDSDAANVGVNFNASVSARCLYFQDSFQSFKGTIRLIEVIIDKGNIEYEMTLNGELTSLNVALSGAYLQDLDFSAYDHTLNYTNITSSWSSTFGTGYFYPLIDYGTYSTGKHDWKIGTFRPALFAAEYIDKILTGANFRYEFPLSETARFKGLVVPHNQKKLTSAQTRIMEATITSTQVNPVDIVFDTISGTDFSLTSADKRITYTGTPPLSGSVHVDVVGSFFNEDITVEFKKNGVTFYSQTKSYNGSGATNFFSFNADIAFSFATNDYITCSVSISNTSGGNTHSISLCNVFFDSFVAQQVDVTNGDTVTVNDAIPKNIKQIDFLVSIVKLFNLYIYEHPFDEKYIIIKPYVDFYSTSSQNSVDWTYKLNRDQPIRHTPMSELNAKTYIFKYKDDSDFYNDLYKKRYNETYGTHTFTTDYEFTQQVQETELIFSPTVLVGYAGEDKVYSTIFKSSNDAEESIDSNIRILQAKRITGVTSYDILDSDGTTVLGSPTEYGYAGHFDNPDNITNDLNFGITKELFFVIVAGDLTVTQFNVYWSPYMAEITDKDSQLLTAQFYLTAKDILDLDFSKYVNVDGVLFRLMKIEDYNLNKPDMCKVELLKVINTLY